MENSHCWCGGERGERVPADADGLGCLEDVWHTDDSGAMFDRMYGSGVDEVADGAFGCESLLFEGSYYRYRVREGTGGYFIRALYQDGFFDCGHPEPCGCREYAFEKAWFDTMDSAVVWLRENHLRHEGEIRFEGIPDDHYPVQFAGRDGLLTTAHLVPRDVAGRAEVWTTEPAAQATALCGRTSTNGYYPVSALPVLDQAWCKRCAKRGHG